MSPHGRSGRPAALPDLTASPQDAGAPLEQGRGSGGKRVLVAVAGGLVGLLFLWLAARGVDLHAVGAVLRDADPVMVSVAAVLLLAPIPVLGLRWHLIASATVPAPTRRFVELSFIGGALNNCLPGRLGEVAKAVGLSRTSHRPVMQALGTIITDRVADVVFFAGCFAISASPFLDETWARYIAVAGAALVLVAVAIVVAAVMLARRNPGAVPTGRLRQQLMFLARGLASVRSAWVWARVAVITAAAWGLWMLGAELAAESLGVHLSLGEITFTAAVLGLGTAIPSLPGYVGTYHWLATTCFVAFGVDRGSAFALAILLHALSFIPMTIIGLALMFVRGYRLTSFRSPAPLPAAAAPLPPRETA